MGNSMIRRFSLKLNSIKSSVSSVLTSSSSHQPLRTTKAARFLKSSACLSVKTRKLTTLPNPLSLQSTHLTI